MNTDDMYKSFGMGELSDEHVLSDIGDRSSCYPGEEKLELSDHSYMGVGSVGDRPSDFKWMMLHKLQNSYFRQFQEILQLKQLNDQLTSQVKRLQRSVEQLQEVQVYEVKNEEKLKVKELKYLTYSHTLDGMAKLQLNGIDLVRDIELNFPANTFKVKFRIRFYVGNTKVNYVTPDRTKKQTHNHLYAKVKMCQTGCENKPGMVSQFYEQHYDVYANSFHYDLEIPWSTKGIQRVHVELTNNLCQGWYPTGGGQYPNHNSLSLTLIGATQYIME